MGFEFIITSNDNMKTVKFSQDEDSNISFDVSEQEHKYIKLKTDSNSNICFTKIKLDDTEIEVFVVFNKYNK